MPSEGDGTTTSYRHTQEATQRPDVGLQDHFSARKSPKTYRYDSSPDPAPRRRPTPAAGRSRCSCTNSNPPSHIPDRIKHRKAKGTSLDLFGHGGLDVTEKLDAHEHKGPWHNRMVLGH